MRTNRNARNSIVAIVVTMLAAVGVMLAVTQADAAEPLSPTLRGYCVKSGTGEIRSLALTVSGKCQTNYWGPVNLGGTGAQGPKGDVGPKGDQGEQGPKGDPGQSGTVCLAGHTSQQIIVPNATKAATTAEDLKKDLAALATAKAATLTAEAALATELAKPTPDAAKVVELKAALKAAQVAEAGAQKLVDQDLLDIANPATYTIRACVKNAA